MPPNFPIGEQPADVPSFGCVVYICKMPDGGVTARVANLAGITVTAATQRDALALIVPQFKQQLSRHLSSNEAVPWIDPPLAIEAGEQKLFLPTHL